MAVHSIDAEDDPFAYRYDTQLLIERRDQDLDEDEMAHFMQDTYYNCPYFQMGDEYKIVRKQM